MRTKTLSVAVVAATLLVTTTPAAADDPVFDCRLDAAPAAGAFAGVLSGYVMHLSGGWVAVSCNLSVAGVRYCVTPVASGEAVAVTAWPCVFAPGTTYHVTAYVTTSHGTIAVTEAWRPLTIDCDAC